MPTPPNTPDFNSRQFQTTPHNTPPHQQVKPKYDTIEVDVSLEEMINSSKRKKLNIL